MQIMGVLVISVLGFCSLILLTTFVYLNLSELINKAKHQYLISYMVSHSTVACHWWLLCSQWRHFHHQGKFCRTGALRFLFLFFFVVLGFELRRASR
jgi:hypothetical protein